MGAHFDWSASAKFPGFTEPADGYHGMRFWEIYGYKALAAKLRMDAMRDLGPCMSPFNAWLYLQGLEALELMGKKHCENTQLLAEWPESHECVSWVLYPGLKSHKDYELANKTMTNGQGGVVTFGVVCWNPIAGLDLSTEALTSFRLATLTRSVPWLTTSAYARISQTWATPKL